jgi:transcriptional regulator with XRE-family HTH domain
LGGAGLALASGAVAFSVVSFTAVAQAQEPPRERPRARHVEMLADKLGISVEEVRSGQKEVRDELIDKALAHGRLTAEQAARLKAAEPGELRANLRRGGVRLLFNFIDAAAKVIGIERDEVHTRLQNGQSLAQIAEANGIGHDELVSGMASELRTRIQTALSEGTISQEMATRLLANLDERIDKLVDLTGGKHDGPFRQERPRLPGNR